MVIPEPVRTNQNLPRQIGTCLCLSPSPTSMPWRLEEVSTFAMKVYMQWAQGLEKLEEEIQQEALWTWLLLHEQAPR